MFNVKCVCGESFKAEKTEGSGLVFCPSCGSSLRLGSGNKSGSVSQKGTTTPRSVGSKAKYILFGILALILLVVIYVVNPAIFLVLLILAGGTATEMIRSRPPKKPTSCSRCGSQNIQVINEVHAKRRGCLSTLLNFTIMFFIWWIWLFVWLARGRKTINKAKAICMNCNNQWFI